MRNLLFLIALMTSGGAMSEVTEFDCQPCRDVYEHPEDYGNFAFNLVFGENATLDLTQGNRLRITNPQQQWAEVDLNFILETYGISISIFFITYNITAPNGMVQIVVQDPSGKQTIRSVFADSKDLVVGDGSIPTPLPSAPAPDPEPTPEKPNSAGSGTELIDWGQEGPYYWYREMPGFSLHLAGSQ